MMMVILFLLALSLCSASSLTPLFRNNSLYYHGRNLQGVIGLPSRAISSNCSDLMNELQTLVLDEKQMEHGIVGGQLVENSCRKLMQTDVLAYKTPEEQDLICANDCYGTLTTLYSKMLENHCYDGLDEDEGGSGRIHAASYQLGCQRTLEDLYCIPIMGATLVGTDFTDFDTCGDFVGAWGCCFQNYVSMMTKLGSTETAYEVVKIALECEDDNTDAICPCANNAHPGVAGGNYTICRGTRTSVSLLAIGLMLLATLFL